MHISFHYARRIRQMIGVGATLVFILILSASVGKAQSNSPNQTVLPDTVKGQLLAEGATAIDSYLASQGIKLDKESTEYRAFLYGVLNDSYPQLFSDEKAGAVTYYAIQALGLQSDTETISIELQQSIHIYLPFVQSTTPDTSVQSSGGQIEPSVVLAYNRNAAINYANTWVNQGDGKKRNNNYPDFLENDCTNFTSQIALAGGISMNGDGACRDETTTTEWYVKKLPNVCGYPWQLYRNWAWSTSWIIVNDFRSYMRNRSSAYVEAYPATQEAISLLISRVQPGDFIQLDVRSCWGSWCGDWSPTHGGVIVEKKNNGNYNRNDAFYDDHSGKTNGNDTYKRGLRDKYQQWINEKVTNQRRMVWIQMR